MADDLPEWLTGNKGKARQDFERANSEDKPQAERETQEQKGRPPEKLTLEYRPKGHLRRAAPSIGPALGGNGQGMPQGRRHQNDNAEKIREWAAEKETEKQELQETRRAKTAFRKAAEHKALEEKHGPEPDGPEKEGKWLQFHERYGREENRLEEMESRENRDYFNAVSQAHETGHVPEPSRSPEQSHGREL